MKNVFRCSFIAIVFLIQACAFTDAQLEVGHAPDGNFLGPISELETTAFSINALTDNREDKARIGWKKNGFGANTADITTLQPVEVIVANAVEAGLSQNGHTVSSTGSITISGSVDKFWFDTDVNFWTVEFIGEIQCSLIFIDAATQSELYRSTYAGNYSEHKAGGLNKTWQMIMGKAVDKLVEDIMFDEDLVETLAEHFDEQTPGN